MCNGTEECHENQGLSNAFLRSKLSPRPDFSENKNTMYIFLMYKCQWYNQRIPQSRLKGIKEYHS